MLKKLKNLIRWQKSSKSVIVQLASTMAKRVRQTTSYPAGEVGALCQAMQAVKDVSD